MNNRQPAQPLPSHDTYMTARRDPVDPMHTFPTSPNGIVSMPVGIQGRLRVGHLRVGTRLVDTVPPPYHREAAATPGQGITTEAVGGT